MEKCRFSIIVPVYNVETYLGSCVNSLMNQDYDNYEILLMEVQMKVGGSAIISHLSVLKSKYFIVKTKEFLRHGIMGFLSPRGNI